MIEYETRGQAPTSSPPGRTFVDVNTFYSPRAGGIRTYHQAKIAYFSAQDVHDYVLFHPGPAFAVHHDRPHVSRIEAYGPIVSADPRGYRFMLDYVRIAREIRRLRPAVVESGDPWLTGVSLMLMKWLRLHRGRLVSFYHSDPFLTHVERWAARGSLRPLRRLIGAVAAFGFYTLQKGYDLTVVSSEAMHRRLLARGINAVRIPFGVPDEFLASPPPARAPVAGGPRRLLYAGRLNPEKGAGLLLECLPRLLEDPRVHVTVIGRGPLKPAYDAFSHPRFNFAGFVEDRDAAVRLYDAHDILLAPGPFESFGLAAIEGMARGMAVVGPDRGGSAELLRRIASPFEFPAADAPGFIAAVGRAVDADTATLATLAAAGRRLAEEHGSFGDAIGRMVEFYLRYAEDPAARP
ncbi:MAG: glycosyltransferase [Hyphomicrobiaceae bacterium]|nr:glycosyltransferase [Hyphomicrobiaceae bacterium]